MVVLYTLQEIGPIREMCRRHNLALHLDGARLFNALVETQESTLAVGALFDSISICVSKGLGAPVGSLLIGDEGFIAAARRFRKVMGGGMRQAGYLAAACIYALDYHVDRLKQDTDHAKILGDTLKTMNYVASVRPVQSNIVIFDVKPPHTAASILAKLEANGVGASPFGPPTIRFVTHLDVTPSMIDQVLEALRLIEEPTPIRGFM